MTPSEFKNKKQWWNDGFTNIQVMTVYDNYVMARRIHKPPFVKSIKTFMKEFKEGKL